MEKLLQNFLGDEQTLFANGLTYKDVESQKKQGLVNTTYTKTSKSYGKIFFTNIFTWFNLICFVIAGVLIAVGSIENITFIFVFLANLFIGLFQEIKAKIMVDSISVLSKSKAKVLRNGKEELVDINQVVQNDIIFFETGKQICADCILIEGVVETNESLLTGESKPVKKQKGDQLLGGSFVVSGNCKAVAFKVGMQSYSSNLIKKARQLKSNQSDILKTLNTIIKSIGIILIPLGILTFFDLYTSLDLRQSLIKTSASIIGMMPVGMFLLTSVSLVVGVIKLAKRKTLVQDLYSIEMLARANILCLDKTGTITDGTMKVKSVVAIKKDIKEINRVMKNYLVFSNTNNQTEIALKSHFGEGGAKVKKNLIDEIKFSSARKLSALSFKNEGTYILGAPEFVSKKLDNETKQTIKDLTKEGFRVLLLCQSKESIKNDTLPKNSEPIAIITIEDNIRKDAKKIISWFNENDVQIKIISGDNIDTVCNISQKVGVVGAEKCISLEGLSDDEVAKSATKFNVFGRVSPEQKCILVKALKLAGNRVAMTGDGVNDILALKESDCSIAMASGSEATRSVSNLVMLDSNFSSMPKIVAEGRRVINNISKASSLFLTKTFFTIFFTIFMLISVSYDYPLQPNQILLWETFFIGIPSFFLALQNNEDPIKGSFIANLSSKALPGALVLFLGTMGCFVYCTIIQNTAILATLISYLITFGSFLILLNLSLPLDKFRAVVSFTMLSLCVLSFVIVPNQFFAYIFLNPQNYVFLIINWFIIYFAYAFLKMLFEKIFKIVQKKQKSV